MTSPKKTKCPEGHPYDDLNSYVDKNGYVHCRRCRLERMRIRRAASPGLGQGGFNKAKTHCPKGHGYTQENTYINPQGRRTCRECAKANGNRQTIKKYGITVDRFNELLEMQNGKCLICEVDLSHSRTSICVDHDHSCCPDSKACGKCVRGLLCHPCNRGLGAFRDSPELLKKAAEYLSAKI